MNSNLKKIVMTALFAALACVATMSIRIPTPGTGGYIHPGDAIVILSGPPRWIFCIRSDYICNQRTDCSVFRTCLPENCKRFQITLCSSASRWRDRYRTGSRWVFYLWIFSLWIICSSKYSSQYYSGSRRTDYLLRTVPGINGNSRCKTAHI